MKRLVRHSRSAVLLSIRNLRQNIIALNYPVLRGVIPAYANQLEKAVKRHDLVSVNHRLAALFASYFDIIFAVSRQLHSCAAEPVAMAIASR